MSNLVASFPTDSEFVRMQELAAMAVKSGLLPVSVKTPEQAIVIMMKGRELGIPPMQAFSSIAVVNGKPTMSAELMAAMIYRNVPGAVINYIVSNEKICEIEAKRPGHKPSKFSFTIEDAKRASLTGKGPWVSYPSAMLRARCLSAMARAMFPDALSGVVYTPEELGVEIDDEGDVKNVPESPGEPRDVSPDAENPKEIPKDSGPAPGSYIFDWGTKEKGYRDLSIKQAVERDGLPKVENYISSLEKNCEREKKIRWHGLVMARVDLDRYRMSLELKIGEQISEEDEAEAERMMQDMKTGGSTATSMYDSKGFHYNEG